MTRTYAPVAAAAPAPLVVTGLGVAASREQGTEDGQPCFALYDRYAADQLLSVIAPAAA